jgi:hypothetical protein
MENEIVKEIKKHLNYSIDKNINYHNLISEKKGKLIFIDGGNNEIFSAPSFNLSLIKTTTIFFEDGKKTKTIINECYLLSEKEKTIILKKNNNFPWLNVKFNEKNPEIFRRINEINLANELFKSNKDAYIILDGSLNQQFKNNEEEKIILNLIKNNNVNLIGLIKTNRETYKTSSLYGHINNNLPINIWYTEIFKKNDINYCYTKLHKKSRYIFKIESFKNNIKSFLELLINNSNDPIFQGYPYGLILADKFAKVTNNEVNLIKTKLLKLINNKSIEIELNALNIHDKIDNINQ